MTERQAVIVAGGLATRLGDGAKRLPKCLQLVAGVPLLSRQIESLASAGYDDVVIATGNLGAAVEAYVASQDFTHIRVTVLREEAPLGVGGAIVAALPALHERFAVVMGDTLMDADHQALWRESHDFESSVLLISTLLHESVANVGVDDSGWVTCLHISPQPHLIHADAGHSILLRSDLDGVTMPGDGAGPQRLEFAELLAPLIASKRLRGQTVHTAFFDIGTPERLRRASLHFARQV